MTDYRLHLLQAEMVSRSRAAEAWAEADRIEALALHEGVLDALRKTGWIVDVDDSEADIGITRWILWARDPSELKSIVVGTPLGNLGLLKLKAFSPKEEAAGREWSERVRRERRERRNLPEPPAAGNIFERLLDAMTEAEMLERLEGPGIGDAEIILLGWSLLLKRHRTLRSAEARAAGAETALELWETMRGQLLRQMQSIRECDKTVARSEETGRRVARERAYLEEWGIDPDAARGQA